MATQSAQHLKDLDASLAKHEAKKDSILAALDVAEEEAEFMANAIGEAECRLALMKGTLRVKVTQCDALRANLYHVRHRLRILNYKRRIILNGD